MFFYLVIINYEGDSCFTITIVTDYSYSWIFFYQIFSFFSLSFVFYIVSITIFLSLIVVAMSLYLYFQFEYLLPLILSDAIFHESILFVDRVDSFSLVICLWDSSITLSVAEPLQAVVEIALTVVWDLEL